MSGPLPLATPPPEIYHQQFEQENTQVQSVGCFLGSFDPPHLGHDEMIKHLLNRCEVTLLLLPIKSFDKQVEFPYNMLLSQRIELLTKMYGHHKNIGIGVAHQVLFIYLFDQLKALFPSSQIYFAVGSDVYSRFLASEHYFRQLSLPWGEAENAKLQLVSEHCLLFDREINGISSAIPATPNSSSTLSPPASTPTRVDSTAQVRALTSTEVRSRVARIWADPTITDKFVQLRQELRGLVDETVLQYILDQGLYIKAK